MFCATCGAKVVDGASYCGACGATRSAEPPSTADTSRQAIDYAGFWLRAGALVLDSMVLLGLGIGLLVMVAILDARLLVEQNTTRADALELAGGLMSWLYYALMESSSLQATLGKRALGIRVTDLDGRRVSFGRATGRYFGKVLSALTLGIGYIMAAFTERKQTLHDLLSSCVVVKVTFRRVATGSAPGINATSDPSLH